MYQYTMCSIRPWWFICCCCWCCCCWHRDMVLFCWALFGWLIDVDWCWLCFFVDEHLWVWISCGCLLVASSEELHTCSDFLLSSCCYSFHCTTHFQHFSQIQISPLRASMDSTTLLTGMSTPPPPDSTGPTHPLPVAQPAPVGHGQEADHQVGPSALAAAEPLAGMGGS